jgi:hypothetical protein
MLNLSSKVCIVDCGFDKQELAALKSSASKIKEVIKASGF